MESNLTKALLKNGSFIRVVGTTYENRQDAIDSSLLEVGVLLVRHYGKWHEEFVVEVVRADDHRRIGFLATSLSPYFVALPGDCAVCATVVAVTGGTAQNCEKGLTLFLHGDDAHNLLDVSGLGDSHE